MNKTKKLTILSILIAQALCLHVIERAIPLPIPVPGIKLGFANIISLFTILVFGTKEALVVVVLRTFLGSLFGGGISGFLYSVVGGIFSTLVMGLMYDRFEKWFSIMGISVVGAVFHNIGQILVASMIVSNLNLFYYLPVLLISSVVSGIMIGLTVAYTMVPLRKILNL